MALSLGFIGAGSIANVHAETARRLGIEPAAVWDVNPAKARAFRSSFPRTRIHPGLTPLLKDPGVNAVIVATPNASHAEIACRALEAGKHVFLEKPMAISVEECDRIIRCASRARRELQMGFVYRQAPVPVAVRKAIEAGSLGRIYHAKCSMYRRRGVPGLGGWFTTRKQSGGGPLIDLGVHVLDLTMELCGHPKALRASGACYATFGKRMRKYVYREMWAGPPRFDGVCDVEDHATALIRFRGGLTVELNVTWASNVPDGALPDGVALFGEKGGCRFRLLDTELVIATEKAGRLAEVRPRVNAARALERAFEAQLTAFRKVVERGEKPPATAREGRAVQAVLDAIYRSSKEGREVSVR